MHFFKLSFSFFFVCIFCRFEELNACLKKFRIIVASHEKKTVFWFERLFLCLPFVIQRGRWRPTTSWPRSCNVARIWTRPSTWANPSNTRWSRWLGQTYLTPSLGWIVFDTINLDCVVKHISLFAVGCKIVLSIGPKVNIYTEFKEFSRKQIKEYESKFKQ